MVLKNQQKGLRYTDQKAKMTKDKHVEIAEQYGLCLEECDFLEDKTIWVAALSNGLVVRQDDNRSGREPKVAWLRLGKYCAENDVDIIGLHLKFRSHVIPITSNDTVRGYYFSYGVEKDIDENITRQHYVCGFLDSNGIVYSWYRTPELIADRDGVRQLKKDDISSGKAIIKKRYRSIYKNQF